MQSNKHICQPSARNGPSFNPRQAQAVRVSQRDNHLLINATAAETQNQNKKITAENDKNKHNNTITNFTISINQIKRDTQDQQTSPSHKTIATEQNKNKNNILQTFTTTNSQIKRDTYIQLAFTSNKTTTTSSQIFYLP